MPFFGESWAVVAKLERRFELPIPLLKLEVIAERLEGMEEERGRDLMASEPPVDAFLLAGGLEREREE